MGESRVPGCGGVSWDNSSSVKEENTKRSRYFCLFVFWGGRGGSHTTHVASQLECYCSWSVRGRKRPAPCPTRHLLCWTFMARGSPGVFRQIFETHALALFSSPRRKRTRFIDCHQLAVGIEGILVVGQRYPSIDSSATIIDSIREIRHVP